MNTLQEQALSEREAKIDDALERMGVPPGYRGAALDQFGLDVENYLNLAEDRPGVLLSGKPGIGKTHLACALLKSAALHKMIDRWSRIKDAGWAHQGRFVRAEQLLKEVRDGFDRNNAGVLASFAKKEYLVIDDLGAEKPTEWVAQTWHSLFDHRLNEGLWTVVTTNHKGSDLARMYGIWGEAIESRLRGLCQPFVLKGEDRRRA
jgi:DNA replication protein DnaC